MSVDKELSIDSLDSTNDIENFYDETRSEEINNTLVIYGERISFPKSNFYASPEFKLITIDLSQPVEVNLDCEDMPILESNKDCIYLTLNTAKLLSRKSA